MDTSGFYKNDNTELLYAPNGVMHQDYDLLAENHMNYEYPIDGWYWFDTEEEARIFFNIPKPIKEENIFPLPPI